MRKILFFITLSVVYFGKAYAAPITGITAINKNGQVFITWTNLDTTGVEYTLYKSTLPIMHGYQLTSAQNLGYVHDSSAVNKRFSEITSIETHLKIDSASDPLPGDEGLFVATSTANGSFYYAVVTSIGINTDTTIIAGENSLTTPVTETVAPPEPIWQQSYTEGTNVVQVYVQFGSAVTSSIYPKMTSQGSFPFNFAVCAPSPSTLTSHPLELRLHGGGGNFLEVMSTPFDTGAYGLGMDDWTPNAGAFSSAWYGYYENYDVYSNANPVPDSGITESVTLHREVWTLDWVEKHYPIDTTRLYITGTSMGGSGVMWLAMYIPEKIAWVSAIVPKFDLSFLDDPDTGSAFNSGATDRLQLDTMLGTVPGNLPCDLGYGTYDLLNDGYMMHTDRNNSLPIIFAQSGRNDSLTGWAEKIPFYDSVNANNAGGFYFWDTRGHTNVGKTWNNVPNPYRFSTAISYPAYSNCSINNNPGDGNKNNGDSVGTINGYLDWSDSIIDQPYLWQIQPFITNISTAKGIINSPDSCIVDITLKRLQQFSGIVGDTIEWISYTPDKTIIQQGNFIYNGGNITIPNVKVYKTFTNVNNNLEVFIPEKTPGISFSVPPTSYFVNLYPDPTLGNVTASFQVIQPVTGLVVQLINLTGQVVQTWNYSSVGNGITITYNFSGLAKSEYFMQFTCDEFTTMKKLILQ